MSIQVHVIIGQTGEYSDHTEWAVAAYQDLERATQHADLAKIEAHRIEKLIQAGSLDRFNNEDPRLKNIYDPKMQNYYYYEADYYVISVDLLDAIPGIDG